MLSGGKSNNAKIERSYCLLSTTKLGIPPQHEEMFKAINAASMHYMYCPAFDASHDYEHCQRVVMLAYEMYEEHKHDDWAKYIDPTVLYIACLVHDVGDAKYHVPIANDERDQEDIVRDFLEAHGCTDLLILREVAWIAARVSFSREVKSPERTLKECEEVPALRIVQDADRLDGLGAIGIGRAFVFGGINEERRTNTIHTGIELHFQRFEKYRALMKTDRGRDEAKKRLKRMALFREQWAEETEVITML